VSLFASRAERYNDPAYAAWLRYKRLDSDRDVLPIGIAPTSHEAAFRELRWGVERLFGRSLVVGGDPAIRLYVDPSLPPQAYRIAWDGPDLVVTGGDDRGVLYGAFGLLRRLVLGQGIECQDQPTSPIRFLNHWDDPDGSIERGYAGRSILYEGMQVTDDLARVTDCARLLASVGINGCSLNNVNANDWVYSVEGLPQVAKLADAMRPYHIQTLLSVRFDSPLRDGLESYDPLRPDVQEWWNRKVADIYRHIPDLYGLIIKADSEGEAGPSATGRTHADAANMLARALQPHGGTIFYRGFVYDHKMDWRDRSLDRAKAQYDNFKPLDGLFEPNVILQVKNGPIDFQVREPVSPTFMAMEKTRTICELMITQEYLGQQHHTVYEVPWWKDAISYPGASDVIRREGFAAVCGVGRDENWLGNHLAQANLYGYGRFIWNPDLTSEQIAEEWSTQTFGPETAKPITDLLMRTWPAYEDYTGNLGIGGLTDILHIHYGPSPISSEHNGWGQWHRSDEHGTGMDRTVATGTGMTAQYPTDLYEHLETCPEELLLFFHHVPYTHRLKNGSTIIQHIYDRHYAGAEEVARFVEDWKRLRGLIDENRYLDVLDQLEYQAGHAIVWRDAICQWFGKLSGIPDEQRRVFNEPNRLEAESMRLNGYEVLAVEPWEAASEGKAIALEGEQGEAEFDWSQAAGVYDLHIWHFDVGLVPGRDVIPAPQTDRGSYALFVNGKQVDSWANTARFPSRSIDAHTKTRHIIRALQLQPGDLIQVRGFAKAHDRAALDFVEFIPR
jgi:alpha-glucuronidase